MPIQQQDKPQADQAQQENQRLKAEIGKHVMQTLGQPGDLLSVQVRRLWDDRYRVNVLVGPDAVSAKVSHSFFLVTDSDGKVVSANPRITKKY